MLVHELAWLQERHAKEKHDTIKNRNNQTAITFHYMMTIKTFMSTIQASSQLTGMKVGTVKGFFVGDQPIQLLQIYNPSIYFFPFAFLHSRYCCAWNSIPVKENESLVMSVCYV